MDLKSKGRAWAGNIYHKFETICHEVDEFMTKDTTKYLENQVQTVNKSVKKIYSNVLHDFQLIDGSVEAQAATKNQDHAIGTSVRSIVDVNEKPTHYCEIPFSEEREPVNLRNCDSSANFPKDGGNGSPSEEGSDAVFPKTIVVVEKDVGLEDNLEASHLSHPNDVDSCKLRSDSWEKHWLAENVESPKDRKSFLPSDMPHSQDKRSIIQTDSPRNIIEDVELKTSEEETKCSSTDPSEEVETGFSSGQGDDTPTCVNSGLGVKEIAVVVEHPAFENVICSWDKNSDQRLCIKEQLPVVNDFFSPEDKILSLSSSADEDHKCAALVKHLPEIVVSDERVSCVSMIENIGDYADLSEKVKTNLSFEQDGFGLEVKLTKEHPLVDSRSALNYRSSSGLSLFLREQHLLTEESSSVKDENLPKISLISTNVNSKVAAVDKCLPETSVNGEWLRVSDNEEAHFSGEAETDLSVDSYHSCSLSEMGLEENVLVQKHVITKHFGGSKDSCDLFVHSKGLHLGIEGFNSPKCESSAKPSPAEEHTTIAANFLPTTTGHNTGLEPLHKDDMETYAICSDGWRTSNVPSDCGSSGISRVHHIVQSEPSNYSLSTECSHTSYTEKTEKMCCDYTHSTFSALDLSTMSYVSLSGLGYHDKTGNHIPAFSRTSSSADILDDLPVDAIAADLETVDLSDKANLEGRCPPLDDELLCSPSFRYRNFRSYKELIKEAFTSRKRLVKEYKQLPIWYADFDTDTSLPSEKHLVPHTALSSSSRAITSTSTSSHPCNIGESDWELL